MEYDHGKRLTPMTHELSPLEAAIHRYSNKAREFHQHHNLLATVIGETEKQREIRDAARELEFKHLETELRLAAATTDAQSQVELYQAKNRKRPGESIAEAAERGKRMSNEKHHPSKVLANYMRAVGRPPPSPKHTPHHIVPGKGRTKEVYRSRLRLHTLGVGINDPDNGAWLVRLKKDKGHWSMPDSKSHLEIHTINYEGWVGRHISLAQSESAARNQLQLLRLKLQSGKQPKNVTMPPDPEWKEL